MKIKKGKHSWIDDESIKDGSVIQFSPREVWIKEELGVWDDFYSDVHHLGCHSWPNCDEVNSGCKKKEKYKVIEE